MKKKEILEIMYEYSLEKGLCKNKKAFAMFIGISPTNYSKVFADTTERFCSLNVLLKANTALGNVFSAQWLVDGTGEMYAQNNNVPAPAPTQAPAHAYTRGQYEKVTPIKHSFDDDDREFMLHRIEELEKFNATLLRLNKLLEKEIDDLKKGNVTARAN